jgi:ribonuclease BN (tRNA processing enzyme)
MILQALGTTSGYPTFHRASTSFLLRDKDREILIDAGSKHVLRLVSKNLTDVYITHTHPDHFMFLGMLIAKFRDYPIKIHCLDLNIPAVSTLIKFFTPFKTKYTIRGFTVKNIARLSEHVTVARAEHNAPACCYSFNFDKKITFAFDTEPYQRQIIDLAYKSDYLVHECTNLNYNRNHSTAKGAAIDAQLAKVKNLILTHFKTYIINKNTLKDIRNFYKGRIYFAYDLRKFELT